MKRQGRLKKLAATGAIALTLTGLFNTASSAQNFFGTTPKTPGVTDTEKAKKSTELAQQLMLEVRGLDDFLTSPEAEGQTDEQLKKRANDTMDKVLSLLRQGADPNYVDDKGAPLMVWAFWMAYESDRPDVAGALVIHGANVRQSFPLRAPLPKTEQIAMRNLRLNPAANPMASMSMADHAAVALLESQGMYAKHIETAIAATKALQLAGVSAADLMALRHPRISSFADIATTPLGLAIMVDKNFATPERLKALIDLDAKTQADVLQQKDPSLEFLKRYNAPLQDIYPDAQPGGPEPYTVEEGDTLQSVAGRFYAAMGAENPQAAMRMIAQKNNMTLPANDADVALEKDRVILLPVPTGHMIGQVGFGPNSVLVGVAERLRVEMGAADMNEAIKMLREANSLKNEADVEKLSIVGGTVFYTVKGSDEKRSTTIRADDILRGIATSISESAAVRNADGTLQQGGSADAIMPMLARMNGFTLEDFAAGKVTLKKERMLWTTYYNDNHLHMDELTPPPSYDPSHKIALIVIEPGSKSEADKKGMHDKRTFGAASGTAYGINRNVDLSRIHSWDEAIFSYPSPRATPALRMLFNLAASPIQDKVIFSVSMAQPVAESAANEMRMKRREDETEIEFIRRFMDEMEKNRPIIFEAAGNWRQNAPGSAEGDGRYVQSYLATHSPRAINIGAKGFYPNFTPGNKSTISHYSSYAGEMCGELPKYLGDNQEGTSFSTPMMAALVRQFMEWYGNKLTFEEIMAAGMMTGTRDIMEFDPAGGNVRKLEGGKMESVPAMFRANGGGVPMHERCGAGGIDRNTAKDWNAALKKMVDMKQDVGNGGKYSSQFLSFGQPEVRENSGLTKEYVYRIAVPKNMTLDKLTFLLPQYRGAHADVHVKMPSGYEVELPLSMHDVVSTRSFNYEDVRKGSFIEIRSKAPFGPNAGFYLRGHDDGNVIQKLRNDLRNQGVLHAPNQNLLGNKPITEEEAKKIKDERAVTKKTKDTSPKPVSAPEMKIQ